MTDIERLKATKDFLKERYNEDLKNCKHPELKPLIKETYRENIKAFNIAISTLEKQIPKKPTPHIVQPVEAPIKIGNGHWQKGTTVYKCPNCKEWVSKTYKHCHDCGQALDFNSNGSGTE